MGINYGIRGGDIMDIGQVNSYITVIEKMANVNFILNTRFFDNNADRQIKHNFFLQSGRNICVASVYILKTTDTTPTDYPLLPICYDLTNNTALTETSIETNTQSFDVKIDYIDYKVHILRRVFSVNTSNIYISCEFFAKGSTKDLKNSGISQFLVWTEPTTKIDYTKITDGVLSNYSDFASLFATPEFSSFSSCLLDASNSVLTQQITSASGQITSLRPYSSFFLCDNFTESFLTKIRFLFKKSASGTDIFYLIAEDQKNPTDINAEVREIDLNIENTYSNYIELSIDDVRDFKRKLSSIKKGIGDNVITIGRTNIDGSTETVDYLRCVKSPNNCYFYHVLSNQQPLSPAFLYPLKQNARLPHIAAYFSGNIGDGEFPVVNSNINNKYLISFENGMIDVFTFEYEYEFYNGFLMLFGVGK